MAYTQRLVASLQTYYTLAKWYKKQLYHQKAWNRSWHPLLVRLRSVPAYITFFIDITVAIYQGSVPEFCICRQIFFMHIVKKEKIRVLISIRTKVLIFSFKIYNFWLLIFLNIHLFLSHERLCPSISFSIYQYYYIILYWWWVWYVELSQELVALTALGHLQVQIINLLFDDICIAKLWPLFRVSSVRKAISSV